MFVRVRIPEDDETVLNGVCAGNFCTELSVKVVLGGDV